MNFKEGVHLANHMSNANKVFTNKIATLETLEVLKLNLQNGVLKSELFKSIKEFTPETYRLDMVSDLHMFLNSPNNGFWI